jgi:flagellar motility protein MotE (MotC chaperone)
MKFFSRIRFLPITIVVASLALTAKIGDIFNGIGGLLVVAGAEAQQQPATAPPPAQPAAPGAIQAPTSIAPPTTAQAPGASPAAPAAGQAPTAAADAKPRPARKPADDPTLLTQTEIDLLQQLAERRERIEAREQEIERRAALLRAAETRIDRKIEELKNLEATIEGLVTTYNEQQDQKLAGLVKIYENMKPKQAAKIFEELEMDVLLMVAEKINSRRLAPIMAAMNAERAREITVELSRLRQLPETGLQPGG